MSYHSYYKWDFSEEVTDGLIDELVKGLDENKAYNKMQFPPINKYMGCYGVFNLMDAIMYNVGIFLDTENYTTENLAKFCLTAPNKEKFKEICLRVCEEKGIRIEDNG